MLATVLVAAACGEGTVDDVRSQVEEAVGDARSELEQIDPSGLTPPDIALPGAPTDGSTATDEPPAAEPGATTAEPGATTGAPGPTTIEPEPTATAPTATGTDSTPTASPTASPSADTGPPLDEGVVRGLPWWVLVLGLLVLLSIGYLVTAAVRRRAATAALRARRRDEALTETDWLLGVADEQPAAVDAGPRARDVRVRADRLQTALTELRGVVDDRHTQVVDDLRTSTRQLAQVLVARLDDVVAGRPVGDLGLEEAVHRVRDDRARLMLVDGGRRTG